MAVTYRIVTHYHNRRGDYVTGTYHAARCPNVAIARLTARRRWQLQARPGARATVTYEADNGQTYQPETYRQG